MVQQSDPYELGRRDMAAQILALIHCRGDVGSVLIDLAAQVLMAIPDHPHAMWVRDNIERLAPGGGAGIPWT